MKKLCTLLVTSVFIVACQDEEPKQESIAVEPLATKIDNTEKLNTQATVKIMAYKVMCPGMPVNLESKKQCKKTTIKQKFNLFDSTNKLVNSFYTHQEQVTELTLPAGKYHISSIATPVMEQQNIKFTLAPGAVKDLEIQLALTLPKNKPLEIQR